MTARTHPASGGSTSAEATEARIRAAHAITAALDLTMSASKIMRLVRRFEARIERNGWNFFEFFSTTCHLTLDQRRRALADPDTARAIAYTDHTGETAVHTVLRQRGY